MASTFTNLLYHIVFSTKHRVPAIHKDLRERLYEYIGGIVRGEGGVLLEIGGISDHVHLLTKLKADTAASVMVRLIKSNSSRWLHQLDLPMSRFDWQTGYGAFSVSESQLPKVRRYIQNQESHHKNVSFQDELITLLKRNRIEYDERYLLG
ncbi:MAG TPA: IS200/IS605 family transposase [Thermoanaerobaculia bacterium]|jgi:REP element-mobilizing transposase RayT|nr:IS200/IS605 family transposase [Thermoanaerobaculia bacterium]